MVRKNLLERLMYQGADAVASAPTAPAIRRTLKGAIGAVSQLIEALKARLLLDIETRLINSGGLLDRLDVYDADDVALLSSIQTYGQQVPVMAPPHPDKHGRYQIVCGRRRVLAAHIVTARQGACARTGRQRTGHGAGCSESPLPTIST